MTRGYSVFTGEFKLIYIDGKLWKLINEEPEKFSFVYKGVAITPDDGMIFDFASIPRIAWRLIGPPTGYGKGSNYGPAACIHDYLYMIGCFDREWCDLAFLSAMECLNVDKWRRKSMYVIVRMFGKKYYGRGMNNQPDISILDNLHKKNIKIKF